MKNKVHLVQKTESISINEIAVFDDLIVDRKAKTRCLKLGLKSGRTYKERPDKCPHCESKKIVGLQVLGAYNNILFWICDACDKLSLRFPKRETEKYLKNGEGFWTNASDWDEYVQEVD